jgi:pyruvate/2-oxoglutarate dehydrogenase complex dihydrolipoamide dehydrogenase (E3) component
MVDRDPKGHNATDPIQCSTHLSPTFAAGDAGGLYDILHLAMRQGELAARWVAGWAANQKRWTCGSSR